MAQIYFLSKEQFVGPLSIYWGTNDQFDSWAPIMEEKVMIGYFGYKFWNAFKAAPASYPDLQAKLQEMMPGFFYYYFVRDQQSYDTSVGIYQADAENATKVQPQVVSKMIQNYNLAVEYYNGTVEWIGENPSEAPNNGVLDNEDTPEPQNTFGI